MVYYLYWFYVDVVETSRRLMHDIKDHVARVHQKWQLNLY